MGQSLSGTMIRRHEKSNPHEMWFSTKMMILITLYPVYHLRGRNPLPNLQTRKPLNYLLTRKQFHPANSDHDNLSITTLINYLKIPQYPRQLQFHRNPNSSYGYHQSNGPIPPHQETRSNRHKLRLKVEMMDKQNGHFWQWEGKS